MTRPFFLGLGMICVGLGAVGAALPIMPTVPFLLAAAYCFARSNPEWEAKLLAHPKYGAPLRDWRARRAISRKTKVISIAAMTAGAVFTAFTLGAPWVYVSIAIIVIAGGWIATRPE